MYVSFCAVACSVVALAIGSAWSECGCVLDIWMSNAVYVITMLSICNSISRCVAKLTVNTMARSNLNVLHAVRPQRCCMRIVRMMRLMANELNALRQLSDAYVTIGAESVRD